MTWYHPALAQRTIGALDSDIAALRADNDRLRAALDEAARDLQLGKPRNGIEERIRMTLNQQSTNKEPENDRA